MNSARRPGFERRGRTPKTPLDPALKAWVSRRTLAEWRAADEVLRRSDGPARDAHERAVAIALGHLAGFDSVDALVSHYTADRYRRIDDMGLPPDGSVEAWIAEACPVTEGGVLLDAALIGGAALWRRAAELMARG